MDAEDLRALAARVADGALAPDELVERVHLDAVADLGFAKIDCSRGARTGVSEVVYGAGKTAEQIAAIVEALRAHGQERVLVTRLDEQKARRLRDAGCSFAYFEEARAGVAGSRRIPATARSWCSPRAPAIPSWPMRRRSRPDSWGTA